MTDNAYRSRYTGEQIDNLLDSIPTKETLGLDKVNNTSDAEKEVKYAATAGGAEKDILGNVINEYYATKEDLENLDVGDDGSASGTIKFSNGIQLKAEGEEVFIFKDGVEQNLFIATEGGKTFVYAEVAYNAATANKARFADHADTDGYGNPIHEHYATKEEVGNIDTALVKIIEIQNALIEPSDINHAATILNEVIRQQEEIISSQNSLIGGETE